MNYRWNFYAKSPHSSFCDVIKLSLFQKSNLKLYNKTDELKKPAVKTVKYTYHGKYNTSNFIRCIVRWCDITSKVGDVECF